MSDTSLPDGDGNATRLAVIDALRLLAMALVTAHHAVTLGGFGAWPEPVSLGHMGVGLFCAVAGYLAFRSRKPTMAWAKDRLLRLYPAFWLATLAGYAATWATGYKTISLKLFVAQMTGLAYFITDRGLVNHATWFVSLILACYAWAWLAKVSRLPRPMLVIGVAIGLAVMLLTRYRAAGASAALFCLAGQWALLGAPLPQAPSPRWLRAIADHVYEYFLVHGIFMVGAGTLFPNPPGYRTLAALTLGVAGGVIGAVILRQATMLLLRCCPLNGSRPAA